jgi:hypothetical protein
VKKTFLLTSIVSREHDILKGEGYDMVEEDDRRTCGRRAKKILVNV